LIAAPFLGEFGWHVSLWVPWLRYMMKEHYPSRELTVICKPGHEGLYADFAAKIIPYEADGITRVDCNLAWRHGVKVDTAWYKQMVGEAAKVSARKSELITPLDLQHTWHGNEPPSLGKRGVYHKYGIRHPDEHGFIPDVRHIAIHARACHDKQTNRNWSPANWEEFIEAVGPVSRHFAFVGSKEGAYCSSHANAEDMRGVSITELTNIISSCGQIIGPSSGPLALAMLCETPVTWWSPNLKDVPRFERLWNPFGVETVQAADSWQPTVDQVVEACRKFL
jgi:hypothetical protein